MCSKPNTQDDHPFMDKATDLVSPPLPTDRDKERMMGNLTHWVESQISTFWQTGDEAVSPTGERYIGMTSGGITPEGAQYPIWCATPALAIFWWKEAFKAYREQRRTGFREGHKNGFKLYWRVKPGLVHWDTSYPTHRALFNVRARLLISDKALVDRREGANRWT